MIINKFPLVSICIPTYNGSEFLNEALESILVQTYTNIEVIVSDDASIDNTLQIINDFKRAMKIPVYIYNHNRNGIGANWNNCIKKSNGKFIKFLFQDDILHPTCIEKMILQVLKYPKVGLVYSRRTIIYDVNNKKNKEWFSNYENLHVKWHSVKIIHHQVSHGKTLLKDENLIKFPENKIGEPTAVLIRKEIFKKVGFFSTTLKQSLDIEYWYRLMKFYDVVFIDEPLVSFRLHDKQASSVNENNYLNELMLFYESIYRNLLWQLHRNNQKILFFRYSKLGGSVKLILKLLHKIKSKIYKKSIFS